MKQIYPNPSTDGTGSFDTLGWTQLTYNPGVIVCGVNNCPNEVSDKRVYCYAWSAQAAADSQAAEVMQAYASGIPMKEPLKTSIQIDICPFYCQEGEKAFCKHGDAEAQKPGA